MKEPGGVDASDRARRIRAKRRIRQEARARLAELHATPTLRELYAPRAIIAAVILLTVLGGMLAGRAGVAHRRAAAKTIPHRTAIHSLDNLAVALGRYKFHTGDFPTADQGLAALNKDLGVVGWDGPYLVQLFDDPWGRDYFYEAPLDEGGLPDLRSLGPDGIYGTADDLRPGMEFYDVGTAWTNGWLHRQERLPVLP